MREVLILVLAFLGVLWSITFAVVGLVVWRTYRRFAVELERAAAEGVPLSRLP